MEAEPPLAPLRARGVACLVLLEAPALGLGSGLALTAAVDSSGHVQRSGNSSERDQPRSIEALTGCVKQEPFVPTGTMGGKVRQIL